MKLSEGRAATYGSLSLLAAVLLWLVTQWRGPHDDFFTTQKVCFVATLVLCGTALFCARYARRWPAIAVIFGTLFVAVWWAGEMQGDKFYN